MRHTFEEDDGSNNTNPEANSSVANSVNDYAEGQSYEPKLTFLPEGRPLCSPD
jgi:hypothetical protein